MKMYEVIYKTNCVHRIFSWISHWVSIKCLFNNNSNDSSTQWPLGKTIQSELQCEKTRPTSLRSENDKQSGPFGLYFDLSQYLHPGMTFVLCILPHPSNLGFGVFSQWWVGETPNLCDSTDRTSERQQPDTGWHTWTAPSTLPIVFSPLSSRTLIFCQQQAWRSWVFAFLENLWISVEIKAEQWTGFVLQG